MKKITWAEARNNLSEFNRKNGITSKGNKNRIYATVVIKADSISAVHKYTEAERSYLVSSNEKAFIPGMLGTSMYSICLADGDCPDLRIMFYEGWEPEYCYMCDKEGNPVEEE